MARPKSVFTEELAGRAEADMRALDSDGVVQKLKAIAAAARLPAEVAAQAHFVAAETIWRWAAAYARDGVAGLRRKSGGPRPSKLDAGQKAAVLSWLEAGKTAKGEPVHWTLEALRAAIAGEVKVELCVNSIWVWLRKEGWRQKAPRPRRHAADAASGVRFRT
jgi:transposase